MFQPSSNSTPEREILLFKPQIFKTEMHGLSQLEAPCRSAQLQQFLLLRPNLLNQNQEKSGVHLEVNHQKENSMHQQKSMSQKLKPTLEFKFLHKFRPQKPKNHPHQVHPPAPHPPTLKEEQRKLKQESVLLDQQKLVERDPIHQMMDTME